MWRDEAKEAGVAGRWADLMGVAAVENLKAKSGGGGIGSAWTGTAGTDEKPQLLETKAWGLREDDEVEGEGWKEPSFGFPIVLLDVDDSQPRFKSVVEMEQEEEQWETEDEWERFLILMFSDRSGILCGNLKESFSLGRKFSQFVPRDGDVAV